MRKWIIVVWLLSLIGVPVYGATDNTAYTTKDLQSSYSIKNYIERNNGGDYRIIIAMSGGGTRAAALAYGVLKALRAETLPRRSHESLLSEVDVISSVSGGSFTAAYYGLYGEKIFSDFEDDFLYYDVDSDLYSILLSPSRWFSSQGRTENAIEYYQDKLFPNATFADLQKADGPLVIINASDLGNSVRFSFLQEFFDPLCSELSNYPIANAVAASSAVPVVFNPVVLENHDTCDTSKNKFLDNDFRGISEITRSTLHGLLGYRGDKKNKKYIHLVDGGITDNLGLLSLYDTSEIAGGHDVIIGKDNRKPSSHYVLISIDATAVPENAINLSTDEPSIGDTVSLMSNIQFLRYNTSTRKLIKEWVEEYVEVAAKQGDKVEPYIININLSEMAILDNKRRKFLNNIPTALTLEKEQVDELILEGYTQLQNHPDFTRFRNDISQAK